jgi:polysaccharide export outer membrane protein
VPLHATGTAAVSGIVLRAQVGGKATGEQRTLACDAIGMAGGYTKIANPGRVTVKRQQQGGGERLIKLDAKRMARGDDSASFYVKPGDIITVAESLF